VGVGEATLSVGVGEAGFRLGPGDPEINVGVGSGTGVFVGPDWIGVGVPEGWTGGVAVGIPVGTGPVPQEVLGELPRVKFKLAPKSKLKDEK
jgi:hypothetical protein